MTFRRVSAAIITAVVLAGGARSARAQFDGQALVEGWYRRYLGRNADPIGIHDHVQALQRGTPPVLVEAAILSSPEYYRRNGGTPEGFVLGLFRDVLGRPPTPSEMNLWMNRTLSDSRSNVAVRFLREREAVGPPPAPGPFPPRAPFPGSGYWSSRW
jgi:hypothetical protein